MRIPKHFSEDANGQWWYQAPASKWRKRATIRVCPICGEQFLSANPRVQTCSHECGAKEMHAHRPRTTSTDIPAVDLLNSDNPRYSQDPQGQWWYKPIGTKDHPRTRALVAICAGCGRRFLTNIFHRKAQLHCSRSCGLRAYCAENPTRYKGEDGNNWKGGRQLDRRGYVLTWVDNHPARSHTKKPYVFEHRLVMERMLGRYLTPEENVHHRDGRRDNNDPANLELWWKSQPGGQRVPDLIEYVVRYHRDDVLAALATHAESR